MTKRVRFRSHSSPGRPAKAVSKRLQGGVRGNLLLSQEEGQVWRAYLEALEVSGSRVLRSIMIPHLEREMQFKLDLTEAEREDLLDLYKEGVQDAADFLDRRADRLLKRDKNNPAIPILRILAQEVRDMGD